MAILVIMLRSHMAIMMIMLRSSISISDDLHPMVRDFQHLVPYFCSAPAREPDAGRPVGPVAPCERQSTLDTLNTYSTSVLGFMRQ